MKIAIVNESPLAYAYASFFADNRHKVIIIAPDQGKNLINEIDLEANTRAVFTNNLNKKNISISNNVEASVIMADIIMLCPKYNANDKYMQDIDKILNDATKIAYILYVNQVKNNKIIINKTFGPVRTSEKIKEIFNDYALVNCDIVSNPDYLRESYSLLDLMNTERIIVGTSNNASLAIMRKLYEPIIKDANIMKEVNTRMAEIIVNEEYVS